MRSLGFAALVCLVGCVLVGPGSGHAQQADSSAVQATPPPAPPSARMIPGINAPDPFPKGCVSCHINIPEQNLDTRFSTLVKGWVGGVTPALLAKAQAAAPAGLKLKGKHPPIKAALRDIPAGCIKCHGTASKKAPPFARLMHRIHLAGGDENHFMTIFKGECTLCHKLNADNGTWSIPTGPEP